MDTSKLVKHFSLEALHEELKDTKKDIQHFGRITKLLYALATISGAFLILIILHMQSIPALVLSSVLFGIIATFTILSDMSVGSYREKEEDLLTEIRNRKNNECQG